MPAIVPAESEAVVPEPEGAPEELCRVLVELVLPDVHGVIIPLLPRLVTVTGVRSFDAATLATVVCPTSLTVVLAATVATP